MFKIQSARRARKIVSYAMAGLLIFVSLVRPAYARDAATVSGVVHDASGAVVSDASVSLLNAQRAIIGTAKTDAQGRFTIPNIPDGSYLLVVASRGFAEQRVAVNAGQGESENIEVIVEPRPLVEEVTVTATPGLVESVETASQQVNVISELQIEERAKSVTAQVANEEVGVHLQRTSPTISGIFVRGLTGNKVNVFVDGVRYSTAAMRGGINSFLNLIDQTNLQAVEILRGPNSAQYGSDAIGGSVQFLTLTPSFSADGPDLRGKLGTFFNSADASFGSNLAASYSTRNFGLVTNFAGRRVNTLRTGRGIDSHNAVTRFLGLSSKLVIDDRMPDTAFTQYGGLIKMNWMPAEGHQFIATYARSQQDGGRRFDQLLGGDGNLIADLRNFMLDFAYVRYDRVRLGWFDNFTAVYSFNSQREERVNQGGNGNPRAAINHELERTNASGFQTFVNKLWGARQNLLFGAEYYHEWVDAPSFGFNPATGASAPRRGRVPHHATFDSGGVYAQDIVEVIPARLRLIGNLRWSAAKYKARAQEGLLVANRILFPDDSLRVDDLTFRAGVVVTPVAGLSLSANVSRGFRAPHITDLGTLGLTGSGFEVAAPDVAGLGGTIGSTAGGGAVSTGLPVTQVEPETSMNYEVSARYHSRRFDTDFAFFVNDIEDNIVKQALILPPGAVGSLLGTTPITAQNSNGTVFVAASTAPVLVRANFDDARIYGFEHTLDVKLTNDWSVGTVFTYLRARDKRTDLPPNIEGGTPAPDGYLKIRYAPVGRRFWVEPYLHAADRQGRLSSLDLEDRRTGAGRSRGSIANFFNNGARARGLVSAGPDGVAGNADDRLVATGETLTQVQNRVLGVGVNSAPLYTAIPGYVTFNVRGGVRFGERHELLLEFENIGDRNYRGISWGVDAPGRGVFAKYNLRF
ncbi:MAG TPA: TonB-dependent receptor [Blastocatellia bacterium]|nr:TonB-dependent receptor [Blastocatellia bacterium]